MFLNQLRFVKSPQVNYNVVHYLSKNFSLHKILYQTTAAQEHVDTMSKSEQTTKKHDEILTDNHIKSEMYTSRVLPIVLSKKEPIVLSFDEVPGPKSLKYLSNIRQYLSEVGTQLTAGFLTIGLNIGTYINNRLPLKSLSVLFDEYGPVVRFVSPVGRDIVLVNHPEHIEKVYGAEGECPVRSALDSLEKYRTEHRVHVIGGLYSTQGEQWSRQRDRVYTPLHNAIDLHLHGVNDVCDNFIQKVYNMRNHQDEIPTDLYKELHKWAFDCMGLIIFSKKFTMLDTEIIYSQCDESWLYHSLEKATDAIMKCESGLHFWKIFATPAWLSLVKYCDSLDNLIGKHVMEAEQNISFRNENQDDPNKKSIINAMLMGGEKMTAEDIATVIMDMLLIGINTITSSMSFLLYNLAKHQKAQKKLFDEVGNLELDYDSRSVKERTPYLQACIKENLRLAPPIPVLTRILPKNITLDRYNIPRGTLIIMSTRDASLKESNFDDPTRFIPERWLGADAGDYHAFASIPFGHGARKCMGQNIAETMMSLLAIKMLQKYKLEYHYGDIQPTRSFIAKPNRPLKIRFIDRV